MTGQPGNPEVVQAEFSAAKQAFERGDYRKSVNYLEKASALVNLNSQLGGDIQTWLVTAYEAAGQREEAIALCRALTRHPDLQTRKEGKRILYILEAPKLQSRPEWLTQIPDLGSLTDNDTKDRLGSRSAPTKQRTTADDKLKLKLEPVDLNQVNTEDNRFIWVALLAILVVLASLFWLA